MHEICVLRLEIFRYIFILISSWYATVIMLYAILAKYVFMSFLRNPATKIILFVVFGIIGIAIARQQLMLIWPLIIVYGTLVWKGYASHSFVSKVIPAHTIIQKMLYAILFSLHLSLAFSFAHPAYFSILMLTFLLFETFTYTLKLSSMQKPESLFRKIKINMAEALLALFAFVGVFFGYAQLALIIWCILLTDISIYSILFRRMYAVPNLS